MYKVPYSSLVNCTRLLNDLPELLQKEGWYETSGEARAIKSREILERVYNIIVDPNFKTVEFASKEDHLMFMLKWS